MQGVLFPSEPVSQWVSLFHQKTKEFLWSFILPVETPGKTRLYA